MRKMGFADAWISWTMVCVNSVSYRVLLNGELKGTITPSRGLRQGNHLSPYLFILCTEVFIANLRVADAAGGIRGIKVAPTSPPISHLLFVDDSLFFCKTTTEQCDKILQVLNVYGNESGQQ